MSPAYADGYGRWHVLVDAGPSQRDDAAAAMLEALMNANEFTDSALAEHYVEEHMAEAPTDRWDLSPGFGGVAADMSDKAHYVEWPHQEADHGMEP